MPDHGPSGGKGIPKQLWVLMGTVFVDMIGMLIVLPLLPYYAVKYNAGGFEVGLLTAIFAGAQFLSAPIWGRLSDRHGRRPVILAGLLASAVGFVFFGLENSLWMLFATRLMQGFGGGTIGVIQAYVSDTVGPKGRARALGWLTVASSAGVTLGPIIGSKAANYLGSQGPGFVAAGLCLLNVLFAWRMLPESSRKRTPTARRSISRSVVEVIQHPWSPSNSMIWIYSMAMMAFLALNAILALYLKDRFGITEDQIGYFYTYVGGISVLMRAVLLGRILDRFGEIRTMRFGALSMTMGFFLIPLAVTPIFFLLAATLIPIGTALLYPTTIALLTQRSPESEIGQILGVQQSFKGVAGIVGPAGAGAAYEYLATTSPMLIAATVMTIVTLCTLAVRSYDGEEKPEDEPSGSTVADS